MLTPLVRLGLGVTKLLFRSHYVVRGNSMSPALRDGDVAHAIPAELTGARIRRGAIVVAAFPGRPQRLIIKRVAGLPGEWVNVSREGVPVPERSWDGGITGQPGGSRGVENAAAEPGARWLCDDDEFFLVGDNLPESSDSRRFGPVRAAAIIGTVWLKVPTHTLLRHRGGSADRATPPDFT